MEKHGLSTRDVADATGISHGTIHRLVTGKTQSPHPSTRRQIEEYLSYLGEYDTGDSGQPSDREHDGADPEEDLLEYFLENAEQMATFMSTTTEGLNPRERRMVAMAILNGFKRLLIEAGEPIPAKLKELERRFVDEAG